MRVQACGDCHLLNFGGFATPERNILFDINDFDETLPAPWEWDVKRLVASFVLAARSNGLSDSAGRDAAVTCARSYRKRLRDYSEDEPARGLVRAHHGRRCGQHGDRVSCVKARIRKSVAEATEARVRRNWTTRNSPEWSSGQIRIHDAPPLIFHPNGVTRRGTPRTLVEEILRCYRDTLSDDRRELLDQYRLVDVAHKVVGIGSVGTRCCIVA